MDSSDDTQPLTAREGEGRRYRVGRQRPKAARRARLMLLVIISVTACTLAITLVLFLRAMTQFGGLEDGGVQVSIDHDGAIRSVSTRLDSVGELLTQLAIEIPEEAALSHSASDRLVDGMVIRIALPRTVSIIMDEGERQIQTPLKNPWDILLSTGVAVDAEDKIWVNGALADYAALPKWTAPALRIEIRSAVHMTLIDDGVQSTLRSNAASIGDALDDAGIELHSADRVTPSLEAAPADEMIIHIKRALPIILIVDGVNIDARSNAPTVGDALIELNAPLFGDDYVVPPAETALSAGMTIEIVRVTEDFVTESAAIDFAVKTQLDDRLKLDDVAVLQEGRAGSQETRYRVRYENGIEVARDLIETVVVEPPIDKIVAYGAKVAAVGTVPGTDLAYWRRVCVIATNYDPESQGGSHSTATGATLQKGVIAAKPHIIPYYTAVFVPGYGRGAIRDTGAGPRSTPFWIDLGYGSRAEADAENAHTRYTWVYHLWPPPEKIIHILPSWRPSVSYPSGGCGA